MSLQIAGSDTHNMLFEHNNSAYLFARTYELELASFLGSEIAHCVSVYYGLTLLAV